MRVNPLSNLKTRAAAVAVAALFVAGTLYVANRIVATEEPRLKPTLSRGAATLPEPMQTSNRAAKAAREASKRNPFDQARRAPDIASPKPEIVTPIPEDQNDEQERPAETGRASWYDFTTKTASGEYMNGNALTAAHRRLPFGSKVRVANLDNGRSVVVRINDRGPFTKNRIIDVSRAAAAELGMIRAGVARVSVSLVKEEVVGAIEPRAETRTSRR